MERIKDKQLVTDTWQFLTDDAPLVDGDVSVSLARWQRDHTQILARTTGQTGVRLTSADNVALIADAAAQLQLIELDFPDFADGRLFSHAWLLRSRYGFQGELRAVGQYMSDQVFYLSRVGVNAFKPNSTAQLNADLQQLAVFSVAYQTSVTQ